MEEKNMIHYNNVFNNPNIKCIAQGGQYFIYEHQEDLSVSPWSADTAYFMKEMNVKKRQVLVQLNNTATKIQAGAMQWMAGNIEMNSGVTGVGNFLGKMVKGAVTGESAAKPVYTGQGYLMLEPTFAHLLIEDVAAWGQGIVLDDGLFLACDANIKETIVKRNSMTSAAFGGEGLFNLALSGQGYCVLESPVPREELFEFNLENDVIKIDGNMAIAWSSTLEFSVEKATKSLMGSAVSKEGFVNVYRGTGKILMAPTIPGTGMGMMNGPEQTTATK